MLDSQGFVFNIQSYKTMTELFQNYFVLKIGTIKP